MTRVRHNSATQGVRKDMTYLYTRNGVQLVARLGAQRTLSMHETASEIGQLAERLVEGYMRTARRLLLQLILTPRS